MLRRRTAASLLITPFFFVVQPSHWREPVDGMPLPCGRVIGARCGHFPFLSIRDTLWKGLLLNAVDDAENPLIPILLALEAFARFMFVTVFTKCGDSSSVDECAMGKFGSDFGASSCIEVWCLDVCPSPLTSRPLVFITFIAASVSVRSSAVCTRFEFVCMNTPSHVILIVVTILAIRLFIAHYTIALVACSKLHINRFPRRRFSCIHPFKTNRRIPSAQMNSSVWFRMGIHSFRRGWCDFGFYFLSHEFLQHISLTHCERRHFIFSSWLMSLYPIGWFMRVWCFPSTLFTLRFKLNKLTWINSQWHFGWLITLQNWFNYFQLNGGLHCSWFFNKTKVAKFERGLTLFE